MSSPREPATDGTSADHGRSGEDVAEAIEVAERGSSVQDVHDQPGRARSGESPVERAAGDAEMTEGQVVLGDSGTDGPGGGGPESESSGAAQSQRGARASDLRAAGEDQA